MKPILLLITILLSVVVFSQAPIVRQNGNSINFHNSVIDAVNAANNGDTIYMPIIYQGSWTFYVSLIVNLFRSFLYEENL